MKKRILTLVLAGIIVVGLDSCAAEQQAPAQSQSAQQESLESDIQTNQNTNSFPAAHFESTALPAEYQITYEMENGDGTLTLITLAKDIRGNIYYRDGETEQWFLSRENGYIEAQPNEAGELTAINSGLVLQEDYIKNIAADFWDCAETTDKLIAPGFQGAGNQTVAGRSCHVYTNTQGITSLNVTYSLYVDQETGICMGWTETKETGIFDSGPSAGTFLCSEFLTENITLP